MLDILKGAAGKAWVPLLAWIFPSALAVLALWFVAEPMIKRAKWPVADTIAELTAAQGVAWLAGTSIVLGIILNATSTPLYRLLEGYSWPKCFRNWAVKRQKRKFQLLRDEVNAGIPGQDWEFGLALERLSRFPADDNQIAPTRLGNAIRSFETYGSSRFNLDSQTLWTELCSLAPEPLISELELARAFVDFFIAAWYLSCGFALISLTVIVFNHDRSVLDWLAIILPLGLAIVCYNMANVACSSWSAAVQALVNLGRKLLAEALGLELPATLGKEREMWTSVVGFVFYGDASGEELDRFRVKATAASDQALRGNRAVLVRKR